MTHSKVKGWKEFVYERRMASARQHRAEMRAFAMGFREEIAPDYLNGKLSRTVERGAAALRLAICYRDMANQSLRSAAEWIGGAP